MITLFHGENHHWPLPDQRDHHSHAVINALIGLYQGANDRGRKRSADYKDWYGQLLKTTLIWGHG